MSAKQVQNGQIGKVIGLDPASPFYSVEDFNSRISNDSAKYVECIHTGFWLGIRDPICQVDFYVNGGMHQPGCSNFFGLDDVQCSHIKALYMFTQTFETPKSFEGVKCENLQKALEKSCKSGQSAYINDQENANKNVNGIYYVKTTN